MYNLRRACVAHQLQQWLILCSMTSRHCPSEWDPDLNSWGGVRQRNHTDVRPLRWSRLVNRHMIPDNGAASSYNSLIISGEGAARKSYTLNWKCADVTWKVQVNGQAWYGDTSVLGCAWTCRDACCEATMTDPLSMLYVMYGHTLSLGNICDTLGICDGLWPYYAAVISVGYSATTSITQGWSEYFMVKL